jgi:hypothetical protein
VKILHRHAPLPQRVLAARPPPRFSGGLNRRQQQRDQDADDGNDNQELNQRKSMSQAPGTRLGGSACRPMKLQE